MTWPTIPVRVSGPLPVPVDEVQQSISYYPPRTFTATGHPIGDPLNIGPPYLTSPIRFTVPSGKQWTLLSASDRYSALSGQMRPSLALLRGATVVYAVVGAPTISGDTRYMFVSPGSADTDLYIDSTHGYSYRAFPPGPYLAGDVLAFDQYNGGLSDFHVVAITVDESDG